MLEPKPDKFSFDDKESGYSDGENFYKASTLYKTAEEQKCIKFKYYLSNSYLNTRWNDVTPKNMAEYYIRIQKADKKIPIILTPNGWIADGYHRLVRAIIDNDKYLWAYRLDEMPDPDKIIKE